MERGLVSIEDLTETLMLIAKEADKTMKGIAAGQVLNGRSALQRIKWEATDAVDRAERGVGF